MCVCVCVCVSVSNKIQKIDSKFQVLLEISLYESLSQNLVHLCAIFLIYLYTHVLPLDNDVKKTANTIF